jgi:hypothetical protein
MEQTFYLRRGDILALQGGGATVELAGGDAWITQYGDINDYVVREDDRWTAKSDGLVLVHALHACFVTLSGGATPRAELRRRGEVPPPKTEARMPDALQVLRRWFAFA